MARFWLLMVLLTVKRIRRWQRHTTLNLLPQISLAANQMRYMLILSLQKTDVF